MGLLNPVKLTTEKSSLGCVCVSYEGSEGVGRDRRWQVRWGSTLSRAALPLTKNEGLCLSTVWVSTSQIQTLALPITVDYLPLGG